LTTTKTHHREDRLPPELHPVFSVPEFCFAHGKISRAFFYKLVKQGLGPRLLKVGHRTLITAEAAAEWRNEMEIRTAEAGAA
jgi:hypothetical protein